MATSRKSWLRSVAEEQEEKNRKEEEGRKALELQRAGERNPTPSVQGPSRQLERPSMRPQISVPEPGPQIGVSRPETYTGAPGIGITETYPSTTFIQQDEEEPLYPTITGTFTPGGLQRGQQGPVTPAQYEDRRWERSGISLTGVIPPSGLPIVDRLLGLEPEPDREEPSIWERAGSNLQAGLAQIPAIGTQFTQDIAGLREWYQANPNVLYAEDMAARRQIELESGETGRKAAAWRLVGEMLANTGTITGRGLGNIISWVNRPENLQGRNVALNRIDELNEMGLIPATTPFSQLLNAGRGAAVYEDTTPGPSLASIVTPIGAALNRAFNPLNPNREQALWQDAERAETVTRGALYDFLPGTPDDAERVVNNLLANFGVDANIQLSLPEADTVVGRITNAFVWSAVNGVREYEKIQEGIEVISEAARVAPELAMFKRNVWSGGDNMMNGFDLAFNRQEHLDAEYQDYLAAVAAGDLAGAALIYADMQELATASYSTLMEENMNAWAEVGAGVFFDLGLFGFAGDKVGDVVKGVTRGVKARAVERLYNISTTMANENMDLYLANSRTLLRRMPGASNPQEIRRIWQELTRPQMGAVERVVDVTGVGALTRMAKAELDSDTLLHGVRMVLKDIETKEDAVSILSTLTSRPKDLYTKGIAGLTSPRVRAVSPTGALTWGAGVVANSPLARRLPILKMARRQLLGMESLKGTGKLNGEQFFSELSGIIFDNARVVNGVVDEKLPFGAARIELVPMANGKAAYQYVNKAGGRLFISDPMSYSEAQNFVRSVQGSGFGAAAKVAGQAVRLPFNLQKRLMSDMWLGLRPANWIRNAVSGTAMLLADDIYGMERMADIEGYFLRKLGTGDVLEQSRDIAQGARREVSGLFGPIFNRIFGKDFIGSKMIEGGYNIAYGKVQVGNIPVSEGAMRAQGAYKIADKEVRTSWRQVTNGVYQRMSRMGLDGKIVDQFIAGLYEVGVYGNKTDVMKYINDFAQSGRFRVSMTGLGLPEDVLAMKTYTRISQALNGTDISNWQAAQREIRAAIADQRRWGLTTLESAPKQQGSFTWMKHQVPDQAAKIADLRRRYQLRAGASAQQANQAGKETAELFLRSHAISFDNFRMTLRQSPNNPNSWGVVTDYYQDMRKLQRSANKRVDDLARDARYTNDWDFRDKQVEAIYAQLAKDQQALSRKYAATLRKVKMGTPYTPKQKGWGAVLEENALFDRQWFKSVAKHPVTSPEDTMFPQKIAAWRMEVESAAAEMVEAFRMFPSMDNFDVLSQTFDDLTKIGRQAAQRRGEYVAAMKGGRLSLKGYYNRTNKLWEQAFGLQAAQARSTARAMVAHAVMTNTSESLRFEIKGRGYYLYAPDANGIWKAIDEKTGAITTFAEEGVQSRRPKLPPALIEEYYRLSGDRTRQVASVGAAVRQAADAAVPPAPADIPPARVVVPSTTAAKPARPGRPARVVKPGKTKTAAGTAKGPLDPTEGMTHEEAWNNYADILIQRYGYTRRDLQNMSEQEFRWAVQDMAAQRPPEMPRGVDTGDAYKFPLPPAPDRSPLVWGTPGLPPTKEEFGYDVYNPSSTAGRWDVRPEDAEEFGYDVGRPLRQEDPLEEEFGYTTGQRVPRWTEQMLKPDVGDEFELPPKFRVPRTVPGDLWVPEKPKRADFWGRKTDNVVYYVDDQPYLRMTVEGGGRYIPPGSEGVVGAGGTWRRAGKDAYYVVPLQPEELPLTPGGLRKKGPLVAEDVEAMQTGRILDAKGRHFDDPNYQFWTKGSNDNVDDALLAPVDPGPGGKMVSIGNKDQLQKALDELRPPRGTTLFDNLNQRWRLPDPVDRQARIVRDKLSAEATEFSFKRLPKGSPDVRLVAAKTENGFNVQYPGGRPASGKFHKTLLEAEAEADMLMTQGIGVGADGFVVVSRGYRRRLPTTTTTFKGREFARSMLKGKGPAEILQETFEDAEGKTLTGRDLLKMTGYTDKEIAGWVADKTNGRRSVLDALEAALGMRAPVGPGDMFFYGGLPIPPEVIAFFRDTTEMGIKRWAGDILRGMGFSQRTAPFKTMSVSDMALHELESLDEVEDALTNPAVLQTILGGTDGMLSGAARSQLSGLANELGQMHDNVVGASVEMARDMVNWAMLDFRKQRNIDSFLPFLAPFSFFLTRMPGRAVTAALKKPSLLNLYYEAQRGIDKENERSMVPQRLEGTLPIPGTEARVQVKRLITDVVPTMMYLAADSFLQPNDIEDEGDAVLAALDQSIGLGPLQRLLLDWSLHNGDPGEMLTAGNMLPFYRMYGYQRMAQTGELEQVGPWMAGTPYDAGIVGRNISANVGVGTDVERYAMAAAAYAREGQQPPEGMISPEAQDLYQQEVRETGSQLFWRAVSSYLFSPVSIYSEEEQRHNQMVRERRSIRFDEGKNPAGSRAATRQYDEATANEGRDFLSYVILYDREADPKQVLAAAQQADLDKRKDAINDYYDAIEEDYYSQNPNLTEDEYWDFANEVGDQRRADIEAAEKELELGATYYDDYPFENENRYAAENPQELQIAAMDEAKREATAELEAQGIVDPGELDDPQSWEEIRIRSAERDAYKAQVDALAQQKIDDPQWVQAALGGRDVQTGKRVADAVPGVPSGQERDIMQRPDRLVPPAFGPSMIPRTGQPPAGAVQPDPNNPWFEKMVEQEELYDLPPGILQEIARHESNFTPDATNDYGMQGMYQFDPDTWNDVQKVLNVEDPLDPEQAIEGAAYYLDWIRDQLPQDKKNDPFWLAAAYNAGIGNVRDMQDPNEILSLPYADNQARLTYATNIANTVNAGQAARVAGTPAQSQSVAPDGQAFIRPIVDGADKVTQGYGEDVAYYEEWNEEYGHEGIDYGVPVGTPVVASAGGTVEFAGTGNGFGNYGNYVVVDHGNGYKSYYAHLDSFGVQPGDTIEQGQEIAKSGNSGNSSGPHLHFSLRYEGETDHPYGMVDPTAYILGRETPPGVTPPAVQQVALGPEQGPAPKPTGRATVQPAASMRYDPTNPAANVTLGPAVQAQEGAAPTTMTEYRKWQQTQYQTPSEKGIVQNIEAGKVAARDYASSLFPDYMANYDEYQKLVLDEERQAYMAQHPEVRAVNLAIRNPKEFQAMTERFGANAGLLYARIPTSEYYGGQPGARRAYYNQNPDAFMVKAWIDGRPKPEDANEDPLAITPRNWGKDYLKAEELFGPDIWSVVRQYQTLPYTDSPQDKAARRAFYEANPQYNSWADWWYGLLPDTQAQFASYGGRSGYNGFNAGGSGAYYETPYIEQLKMRGFELARARRSGVEQGGWRKWMSLANQ